MRWLRRRAARFPKQLRTEREDGIRPELLFCRDEAAQATEVCDRVLEAREQGMELREQAVLSRTSHDTDLLELELTRRRIPYVKYGGLRYLEAAHVKDLIALLRLADNPGDEISWFRVLQLVEGVGPATARRALDVLMTAPVPRPACPLAERAGAASRECPPARRRCRGRAARKRARKRRPARAPSGCVTRSLR